MDSINYRHNSIVLVNTRGLMCGCTAVGSRENNIIQIHLPGGITNLHPAPFMWAMFGVPGVPIRWIVFNKINKMDNKIGFEMSLIVVEAIRGRCASFMILTATVSEICGGQTKNNSSILVVQMWHDINVGRTFYNRHSLFYRSFWTSQTIIPCWPWLASWSDATYLTWP